MRNRIVAGAVAAAGLLGLIGGTVVANAGTAITAPETITAVATVVRDKFVDVGKQGLSVGDTLAWTLDIKSQDGVDLGTERIQCAIGTDRWAMCAAGADITGRGEVVAAGLVDFGPGRSLEFDVPITGGTGDFANVHGVVHVELKENHEIHTYELLP